MFVGGEKSIKTFILILAAIKAWCNLSKISIKELWSGKFSQKGGIAMQGAGSLRGCVQEGPLINLQPSWLLLGSYYCLLMFFSSTLHILEPNPSPHGMIIQ